MFIRIFLLTFCLMAQGVSFDAFGRTVTELKGHIKELEIELNAFKKANAKKEIQETEEALTNARLELFAKERVDSGSKEITAPIEKEGVAKNTQSSGVLKKVAIGTGAALVLGLLASGAKAVLDAKNRPESSTPIAPGNSSSGHPSLSKDPSVSPQPNTSPIPSSLDEQEKEWKKTDEERRIKRAKLDTESAKASEAARVAKEKYEEEMAAIKKQSEIFAAKQKAFDKQEADRKEQKAKKAQEDKEKQALQDKTVKYLYSYYQLENLSSINFSSGDALFPLSQSPQGKFSFAWEPLALRMGITFQDNNFNSLDEVGSVSKIDLEEGDSQVYRVQFTHKYSVYYESYKNEIKKTPCSFLIVVDKNKKDFKLIPDSADLNAEAIYHFSHNGKYEFTFITRTAWTAWVNSDEVSFNPPSLLGKEYNPTFAIVYHAIALKLFAAYWGFKLNHEA